MFYRQPQIVDIPTDSSHDDALEFVSCKSDISQSSQEYADSQSSTSSTSRKFNHYHEPTVLDRPEAILAISSAIAQDEPERLSFFAYTYGLPCFLRAAAWPILLRNHPDVLHMKSVAQQPLPLLNDDIPVKRIRGDIKRMFRQQIFTADMELIETTVVSFLLKWGGGLPYESMMVWVADFLLNGCSSSRANSITSTPLPTPVPTPSQTPLRSPVVTPPRSPTSSPEPEPEPPMSSCSASACSSSTTCSTSSSKLPQQFKLRMKSPRLVSNDDDEFFFDGVNTEDFPEVFTNFMFIVMRNPPLFSEFIGDIKTVLPVLDEHFNDEGLFSSVGGDVWLVWWLKWFGVRALPSELLCRLWDQYFSFRSSTDFSLQKLHMGNCLVVMKENVSKLQELDKSECRQFLIRLPPCKDVEAIVNETKQLLEARDDK